MALYDIARLPTAMVVRPSGIWNARAPFHTFLKVYKSQQRSYDLSTLCLERVGRDLLAARDAGEEIESFLVVKESHTSRRVWRSYVKARVERNLKGELKRPIYSNTRRDLLIAHESLKRNIMVSSFSLFEAYVNSWLLNYLLWKLESGQAWTFRTRQVRGKKASAPLNRAPSELSTDRLSSRPSVGKAP